MQEMTRSEGEVSKLERQSSILTDYCNSGHMIGQRYIQSILSSFSEQH